MPIKLEVGKTYLDRTGDLISLQDARLEDGEIWLYDRDGHCYKENGCFYQNERICDHDLIKEYIPEAPAPEPTEALIEMMNLPKWRDKSLVLEGSSEDMVDNPSHYTMGGIELVDILEAKHSPEEVRGGMKFQIHQYLFRSPYKANELEDVKKAQWWMNRLVAYLEKEEQRNK